MFTLPDTEINTDKKWLVWNCVEVFTLHRDKYSANTQIPLGFCTRFICLGLCLRISHCHCKHTISMMKTGILVWVILSEFSQTDKRLCFIVDAIFEIYRLGILVDLYYYYPKQCSDLSVWQNERPTFSVQKRLNSFVLSLDMVTGCA